MLLEAPPSRYRVVERDGRLTVVDTQGDGAVRSARDLIAHDGQVRRPDPPAARPVVIPTPPRAVRARPDTGSRLSPQKPVMQAERAQPPPDQTRRFNRNDPLSEPPGMLRSIAATLAGDARDDAGRLLLDTAPWYDAKAPRTIALDAGAETRLGALVVAAAIGAFLAIVLVVMGESLGWIIAVIGFVAIGQAKPVVTRWFDRLQ